jgi:hypothetical protein
MRAGLYQKIYVVAEILGGIFVKVVQETKENGTVAEEM